MAEADLPPFEGFASSATSIQRNADGSTPQNASLFHALAILKKRGEICQYSLYDFLAALILRVIDEQPQNVIDFFELYCRQIREDLFHPSRVQRERAAQNFGNRFMQSLMLPNPKDFESKLQGEEFELEAENEEKEELEGGEPMETDFIQLQHLWEITGVPLTKLERAILYSQIHIHKHHEKSPRVRYWGKIFSLGKTYYVLEVQMTHKGGNMETHDRRPSRENEINPSQIGEERDLYREIDFSTYPDDVLEQMPNRNFIIPPFGPKKPRPVPAENLGVGVNRFAYYVTTDLSKVIWEKLSSVQPEHISMSKKIQRFLTGDLSAEVRSYPKFPGREKEYLGALITRISAGSHIGPSESVKNWDFDEICVTTRDLTEELSEGEAEAIEIASDNQDVKYTKHPSSLLDSKSWTYQRQEILADMRTAGSGPTLRVDKDGLDDEWQICEYETLDHNDTKKKVDNIGDRFRIYTPLDHSNIPSVVARSNVWLGANALSFSKYTDFTYNGFGVKLASGNLTPEPIPSIPRECPDGSLMMEMEDPSPKEQNMDIRPHFDIEEEYETTTTTNTEFDDSSSEEEGAFFRQIT